MCKTGKTETSVLVLTIILLENLLHTFFFFFLLMDVACVELSHFIFSSTHPPIPDKGRKILLTIRECRLVELHSYFVYHKSKSPYWRCSGKPGTVHKMCILLTLQSSGKTQSTEISWVLSSVFSQEERWSFFLWTFPRQMSDQHLSLHTDTRNLGIPSVAHPLKSVFYPDKLCKN